MKRLLLGLTLMFSTVANAMIIEFDDTLTQGGTISYAGGAAPLIGTGIIFDQILGINTPLNNGVPIACAGCTMSFTSGGLVSSGGGVFEFGGGGSLSITGTAVGVAAGILAAGTFDAPVVAIGGGGNGLFIAQGSDTKPVELTDYYGLNNAPFTFVSSQLALNSCSAFGVGGFSCGVVNADFNNSQVPLPGTLALAGLGLVALGVRRKRQQV